MKNINKKLLGKFFTLTVFSIAGSTIAGCSQEFSRIGSTVLSSTGFVSGTQADSIFAVGNKLSKATQSLTDEQEYYLGRAVAATILSRYQLSSDPSLTGYVNKVANVLAGNSSRPETFGGYHVGILDTNEINAVSAPGGFIFVSRGFISQLGTEDELASVLAHEIGHITLKHGLSTISESNVTDALQIIGKEAASSVQGGTFAQLNSLFGDSVNEITGALLDKGYSRSQEYEADAYGTVLLQQAGYNNGSVKEVLEKLKVLTSSKGGWYETHPEPSERIEELPAASTQPSTILSGQQKRSVRFQQVVNKTASVKQSASAR